MFTSRVPVKTRDKSVHVTINSIVNGKDPLNYILYCIYYLGDGAFGRMSLVWAINPAVNKRLQT